MSDAEAFHNRCRALENAFFSDLDQKLIRELQEKLTVEEAVSKLRAESGIQDEATLKALQGLGITPEALSAFRILPLVAVAWADGQADPMEVTAVRMTAPKHPAADPEVTTLFDRWTHDVSHEAVKLKWASCAGAGLLTYRTSQCHTL